LLIAKDLAKWPGTAALSACFDRFTSLDKCLHPAKNTFPAVAVSLCGLCITRKAGVANSYQCSRSYAVGAAVLQAVDIARLEFPAHDGSSDIVITRNPGVNQKARRINLQVLAFNFKRLAILTNSGTQPLSSYANVRLRFCKTVQAFLSPPLRRLVGVCDDLKDTGGRRRNENLGNHCVLIGKSLCRRHFNSSFRMSRPFRQNSSANRATRTSPHSGSLPDQDDRQNPSAAGVLTCLCQLCAFPSRVTLAPRAAPAPNERPWGSFRQSRRYACEQAAEGD